MFNMFDKKAESNPPEDDLFNFLLQPKSNENSGLPLQPNNDDNLRQSATSDGYNTTFERLLNRTDYESPDKALDQKHATSKQKSDNNPDSEFQQNQAETPV